MLTDVIVELQLEDWRERIADGEVEEASFLDSVCEHALVGINRFLAQGGDADSPDLVTAAEGQVVRRVGLIVGDGMAEAIDRAVALAREGVANGWLNPPPLRRPPIQVSHCAPRDLLRRCLLQLGLKQSPEEAADLYVRHLTGRGLPAAQADAVNKFRFLTTLGDPEIEQTPFHKQVAAALHPDLVADLARCSPYIHTLLVTAEARTCRRAAPKDPVPGAVCRRLSSGPVGSATGCSKGTTREARGATAHSSSRRGSASKSRAPDDPDPEPRPALGRFFTGAGAA